ncbi:MAG: L-serine ammonia-lyase, iron-sulfur-dependent, subunit alpha [Spirochaetaceae bacterium]|nr:L-serine ammonia-lyase, iron-sulfur-dependent, subunit alpha [Spirochaetaceae bacterium]
MNWKFSTVVELLDRAREAGLSLPAYLLARESFYSGKGEDELRAELARRIRVTKTALDRGIREPQRSFSSMTDGGAAKLAHGEAWPVEDELFRRALAYSLSINEVNACGGKVIAFPTAGSCGVAPGLLWAYRDARDPSLGPDSPRFQDAFVVASAVGMLIALRATLAGSAGGCQAECGAAAAMAAAGLAFLLGEEPEGCFDAAALSLKNCLGLACDPVAGLVEVPCAKRNAFMAANALTAVCLRRAGISSVIPFDEVVGAMKAIGDAMPAAIRESAEGGLAATPTGMSFRAKIQ